MRRIFLLALLAGSAHAAPTTWEFNYSGFFVTHTITSTWEGDSYTEGFDPQAQLGGSFSGEDRNRNGVLELDELSDFLLQGIDYFPCMADPSPYGRCSIGRFRYAMNGELDFSAGWSGNDEFFSGWAGGATTGDRARSYSYGNFHESTRYLYWTDQTSLSVVQLPVPEPASSAMAAAGLLLLAARCRRRAR